MCAIVECLPLLKTLLMLRNALESTTFQGAVLTGDLPFHPVKHLQPVLISVWGGDLAVWRAWWEPGTGSAPPCEAGRCHSLTQREQGRTSLNVSPVHHS
jgi:hypothetical protein